ncbi:hypothetical protein CI102_5883 [Trichoderma harzianum]|nr:hypothetical protein CI102_5883 [Trichoderma harzianum]
MPSSDCSVEKTLKLRDQPADAVTDVVEVEHLCQSFLRRGLSGCGQERVEDLGYPALDLARRFLWGFGGVSAASSWASTAVHWSEMALNAENLYDGVVDSSSHKSKRGIQPGVQAIGGRLCAVAIEEGFSQVVHGLKASAGAVEPLPWRLDERRQPSHAQSMRLRAAYVL